MKTVADERARMDRLLARGRAELAAIGETLRQELDTILEVRLGEIRAVLVAYEASMHKFTSPLDGMADDSPAPEAVVVYLDGIEDKEALS